MHSKKEKKHLEDKYMSDLPKKTYSLCPECIIKIPAEVYEEDGKVWIKKNCPEHGEFKEIYYSDVNIYNKFKKFGYEGKRPENPNVVMHKGDECPSACGLCGIHKTHTCLANIAVTNRCDSRCWYCFFFADASGVVHEPSLEQIRGMLKNGRAEKPVPPTAIQLTGGNPELRPDLLDIIKICKEEGYQHIQLNAHGTHKLWNNPKFVEDLRKAGVNTIYLSFDGVSKETNLKNHWEVPYIIENCRKAGLGIVLVPTLIKTFNDHEIGKMINFSLNNIDIIRSLNIQPVSFVGKMPKETREKRRITIPEVIIKIEEQTNGAINRDDFYPVPTVGALTKFIEAVTKKPQYSLSTHFACGAATYIFLDGEKVVPITRFLDVEGFLEYLNEKTENLKNGDNKKIIMVKMLLEIGKFINKEKLPKSINFQKILLQALLDHNYSALGELHNKSLFIGLMHFQDLYNYDIERVERCAIHYFMPDNRIIPFCTFNVLPEIYRDKIIKKFSIPVKDWEKKHGKLDKDLYHRDVKKLESGETYKNTYGNLINFF